VKIADVLAPTHACTTATDASVNHRRCVPQRLGMFPSPLGKITYVLASTLARTTAADAPVNYRMYVPHRPSTIPSPQWENG
jgi:hypothetical protein